MLYTNVATGTETTSSKATESENDRDDYDEMFFEIGSSPTNYETSNSLGKCSNGYNQTFTIYELSGIRN